MAQLEYLFDRCPNIIYYFGMKLRTGCADRLMLIVAKINSIFLSPSVFGARTVCVFLLPEEYRTDQLNNYC